MSPRLIPRDIKFLDLFAESGLNLAAAAARLKDMIEHYDRLDERIAEIQALEKESDRIDDEINRRLEAAFVAPFDREDIHELTVRLDDVVDLIQAVGESMIIYDVRQPTNDSRLLAGLLAAQSVELSAALTKLDKMKGLGAHLERHLPRRDRPPVPREPRPVGRHQVARDLPRAGERHRRRRGRGRGNRAHGP
jgi:uncharacterized protein Yka (UPF0111/DUF47 family)